MVFDNCDDNSRKVFENIFNSKIIKSEKIVRCVYLESNHDLFETKSDNLGISVSTADYVIELQSDIFVTDHGFDEILLKAIKSFSDIIMISGRSTNSLSETFDYYKKSLGTESAVAPTISLWLFRAILTIMLRKFGYKKMDLPKSRKLTNHNAVNAFLLDDFYKTGNAGRDTETLHINVKVTKKLRNRVYISQTACRGPLIINKKIFKELNGFDEDQYFQGFDDHDLAVRGWILNNYVCGFVPVEFYSPPELGSSRKKKNLIWYLIFALRLVKINKSKSIFYKSYDSFDLKKPEIRIF
jgi:UDP-2,3-diacylglucosamine pyrophosphatase LpxH